MPSLTEWKVPPAFQPRAGDYGYDLDKALTSVVGLHSIIPPDAFSADTLGTERAGNGVLIDDGLVLTIGYLITEAEEVWLHLGDGRVVQGHALGFDMESGFGLVQALGRPGIAPLPLGSSAAARVGDRVVVGGAGGRTRSVASQIVAKQEFAGYWEYLLDEAIFTHPAHPNWGGTAMISAKGELIGIGSLQLERVRENKAEHVNMIVPIDLLKPILDDLRKFGRVNKPARPWLGTVQKQDVRSLFDSIAHRYDLLNHVLSGGIDMYWRRKAVEHLRSLRPRQILDVATGTADFAIAAMRLKPDEVVGVDIAEAMLARGRMKVAERGLDAVITLRDGEAEKLPFSDRSFDAVIVAFGARNFEDLDAGLGEMYRVLRPGGKIVVLEFSRPNRFPFMHLYFFYFRRILPLIGRFISRHGDAYTYLPETVMKFPEGEDFLTILARTGFSSVGMERLTFGIASIYEGLR